MAAIISVIPIILLFVLMMGFKVSGWKSALTTLVVTILLALFAAPSLGIVPEKYANVSIYSITLWSVVEGFLKACLRVWPSEDRHHHLLSPQSIAIATAACDMEGQDGDIMRKTLPFAIFWILMNGLMVFLGLHVI